MPDQRATVEVFDDDGRTVIALRGEIDVSSLELLRDAIEPHLGPTQTIVLDLSKVDFADSTLLKVLLHARTRLTPDGGSILLRNPSQAARRVLTIAGTQDLLDAIEDDA